MSKKKILVVDDEKLIVKGIRFSLEQDDMEVDCAMTVRKHCSMQRTASMTSCCWM